MSKKDYGTKLAESLRQARQLGTQQPATAASANTTTPSSPTPPAKPRVSAPVASAPKSATVNRGATRTPISQLAVWPD